MKKRLSISIEPELMNRITNMAKNVGISFNALVNIILSEYSEEGGMERMSEYLRGKR